MAAAAEGVPFIFSSQASVPMEDCADAMEAVRPGAPRWFQLYWSTDDALVLTLDTTLLGWRPRDLTSRSCAAKASRSYTSDLVFRAALASESADGERLPVNLSTLRTALAQARTFPDGTLGALRSGEARAVALGRPYVYGLAVAGEKGVREVIRNTIADFDLTLGLAGCASVTEVTAERLVPRP